MEKGDKTPAAETGEAKDAVVKPTKSGIDGVLHSAEEVAAAVCAVPGTSADAEKAAIVAAFIRAGYIGHPVAPLVATKYARLPVALRKHFGTIA